MPNLPTDGNARSIQCLQPLSTTELSFSASAQQTAAFARALALRVIATEDCHIVISKSPATEVTTASMFVLANTVEYFAISDGLRVGAVQSTTGGSLFITEMT